MFLDMPELGGRILVWESEELAGLKIVQAGLDSPLRHFVLTGRREAILRDEDMESYGGRDERGIVNRLTDDLDSMSHVLAYSAILNAFADSNSAQRNELAGLDLTKGRAARRLQTIHKDIAKAASEAKSLATELGQDTVYSRRELSQIATFALPDERGKGDESLFENVREMTLSMALEVERTASDLIVSVTTTASLLNAEKQEQLQKKLLVFTIATFLATTAAVIIALLSIMGIDELGGFGERLKSLR